MISSESELELDNEGRISAASVTNAGGTGGRKVVVGAEVEKRVELG
jgi:hypothetical protein